LFDAEQIFYSFNYILSPLACLFSLPAAKLLCPAQALQRSRMESYNYWKKFRQFEGRTMVRLNGMVKWLTVLLMVGLIAACGEGENTPATTKVQATQQVLNFPNVGTTDLATLDPAQGQNENAQIAISLLYSGLVKVDKDLNIQPDQATWTISADHLVYTFNLRSGIKFADGTSLTASDYIYSWSRAAQPATAAPDARRLMENIVGAQDVMSGKTQVISGVTALSNSTLQVKLRRPAPYFLAALSNSLFFPLNQKTVGQKNAEDWASDVVESGVGTGPFMLKQWERNIKMIFVPNPYYYDSQPQLSEITMFFVSDAATAFKTYRAKQGDFIWGMTMADQALVKKTPGFTRETLLQTSGLFFDTTKPPFNDLAVRQAFLRATDRDSLVHTVFDDTITVAKTILPPAMPAHQQDYSGLSYARREARNLLQSVYPNLEDVPPITFSYASTQMTQEEVDTLQRMWQNALGIEINMQAVEATAYADQLSRHQVQFGLTQWTADYPDPYDFLVVRLYSTSRANSGGWMNASFDYILEQAETYVGAERIAAYQQAERIALDDVALIPLYHRTLAAVIPAWLQGISVNGSGLYFDWPAVSVQAH
jgi:ABC-type oligopeptide transport system substrate-binding subunit